MDDRKPVQEFMKTVQNHLTDLDMDERQLLTREAHNLFNKGLKQRQEPRPHETIVIAPKWETPDEFGLYEIFDDGSFQFLHDILFWALIPTNSKNEIHLCGVDESGLYGYDLEIEDRYDTGWSLDDVEYCMRYEQKGQ